MTSTSRTGLKTTLIIACLGLGACGGESGGRDAVSGWLSDAQATLPKAVDGFELTQLRHYENQVIATLTPEGTSFGDRAESDAFNDVTSAICSLPGLDIVWDNAHELYSSVESNSSGETLLTVQTKRFDCCVVDAMATMSRQDAQNSCPYE
ncbi:MAG: hypothetical protein AAGA44_15195 [Pseudomonadota bacterium]